MHGAYHLLLPRQNRVIPNLRSEGAQETDLARRLERHESAWDWPRILEQPRLVYAPRVILSTSMAIHKHRKVPLSPASGVRVRDDTHKEGAYEVLRKGIERAG